MTSLRKPPWKTKTVNMTTLRKPPWKMKTVACILKLISMDACSFTLRSDNKSPLGSIFNELIYLILADHTITISINMTDCQPSFEAREIKAKLFQAHF
ncbi:hypothetical protein HanXRQr2_Chr09g0404831 [Helianthus annuus]|uniref:Uncharacterized protein n=1 Tax=Helianthus annuus TaxID=4232 RepID=A0A9K3N9X5_HELAN|nr:hypothetical protein HanXRQr2_Chr09g0404831 [Helianthus annuus]KAJ0535966.1 hypothetical protein HanIR_Chr09g0436351 [Helianthus annuus]KAJ0894594.1 hypothetical protein HanPSC8_Chr09g0390771 [Helianthus annuus]